ncbi:Zn-ribbon domain-containing OB-fold protein [Streptomyces clavuligerus]|uniref:DUF35 domain-containing protein n=1 Tax=Streptomyces clavuligerus TaxID=1901 RepID=E2PU86_STRCL|nr:OB-fold domain-containing protein [Streptomyces clavuligerus]ANW21189.1 hypothetical protein BB341_24760 [Streptomyces clavuligerus]AXU15813.1 hypothetical protein D1794_25720 [Streptomyces clavuligerus]EFG05705.1 DUF35 domain-containing protein [Streptomyces clavuligerus]MBY6305937.1 OB-fold domain-containing protein [Streptomyces clavuligerus]QCS08594.1 hypothetical protein CRV15_25090 [Streptomyces clavuligerus]
MVHVPVVAGWFAQDDETGFRLLGTRCTGCAAVSFPREEDFCRNPDCPGGELAEVPLSRRGTIWSYTDGRYRPPPPYPGDPGAEWEPYVLIAVELAAERMVVLGQAAPGVSLADLAVGMAVEVVPGVLYEEHRKDDGHRGAADGPEGTGADGDGGGTVWTTWHWRPVREGA